MSSDDRTNAESYGLERGELQAIVEQHTRDLTECAALWQPEHREELLEATELVNRARERSGVELPQIDVDMSGAVPVLYARGELLVQRDAYEPPNSEDVMGGGFRPRDAAAPQTDFLRLVSDKSGDELQEVIMRMRGAGYAAGLNRVVLLAQNPKPNDAVGKGVGHPVAGTGLGEFPAYAAGYPMAEYLVTAAVVDSGISAHIRSDGWLAGVPRLVDRIDPLDAFPADGNLDTLAGHGTFVSGLIQQIAPWAEIAVYRTAGSEGFSTDHDVAEAMYAADRDGARIINLSLGCQAASPQDLPAMAAAVATITGRHGDGVALIAAAGNFGTATEVYPAAFPGVTSVAAVTEAGVLADWSSRGGWVTCSTLGEGLISTYVDLTGGDPWAVWAGTSFAAARVTGAVLGSCYRTGVDPGQALTDLLAGGIPVTDGGKRLTIP